ncbi:MAG: pyridine nucleotide-disulfide oxidoreductase, partial [Alphaproteobacteria bacterium]
IGSTMMGILLLYPLRKRMRIFRNLGRTASWFFWHMILGIVGPMLILVHSNWKFASLNATVATIVTLIVVASGIIGRYLYTKVHMGLYGHKSELRQIMQDASAQASQFHESLQAFEAKILAPRHNFFTQILAFLTLGLRLVILRERLKRLANVIISSESKRRKWSWNERRKRRAFVRHHLRLYSAVIGKAARFAVFERLFALWHVLHMPLFFLLVASAVAHIIAVHLY